MPRQISSSQPKKKAARPQPRSKPRKSSQSKHPLRFLLLTVLVCALFAGGAALGYFSSQRQIFHKFTLLAAGMPPDPMPSPVPKAVLPGLSNPQSKIIEMKIHPDGVPMVLITGGIAGTRRVAHRQGVPQFVSACGAKAGLNGTFFANASLDGTDNLLIGPSLCGNESVITKGPFDKRPELKDRPLVLISPSRTRLVAYNPQTMDTDASIRKLLPGVTDVFLGGVWLVHRSKAADKAQMARFKVLDANDPRVRAFFGVMDNGRPVLGATTWVVGSLPLAQALQKAGLREAVLLDSGYSTSLVWKGKILVTGHTSPGLPCRPVPHALVLFSRSELAKAETVKSAHPPAA